jgi:hypothetical protein
MDGIFTHNAIFLLVFILLDTAVYAVRVASHGSGRVRAPVCATVRLALERAACAWSRDVEYSVCALVCAGERRPRRGGRGVSPGGRVLGCRGDTLVRSLDSL